MQDPDVTAIEETLDEVDALMRKRFVDMEIAADHILLAITMEGAAAIRTSLEPEQLRDIARMLVTVADEACGLADAGNPQSLRETH